MDTKLVNFYMQLQARDLSHYYLQTLLVTIRIDIQNNIILSELVETNGYYPEEFILDLYPGSEFQTGILKFILIIICVSALV